MYKYLHVTPGLPPRGLAKILLIMRLTIFFLITAILQVSADSFAQKITLSKKNAPLVSIFEEIRNQSGYDFMFVSATLKDAKKVNIDVKNADLEDVLRLVFEGQPLKYTINERSVVVSRKEKTVVERVLDRLLAIDVRGTVVNENGEVLAGATVRIRGANRATLTDSKGFFTLQNVAEDAVLIISFLGYEPVEVKAEKAQGRIVMKSRAVQLATMDVTVNTGYQTRSKERATGSFGKPDMKIFQNRTGTMDIMSRLDGLVPGLTILEGPGNLTGNPNQGRTQSALIRGKGSVRSNTEPLYVVNGMPVTNFSDVNPDDVEDITVLKDAAAAAIWGAKAANGVIVVTTKSGAKNQKLSINYSGFINFQGKPDFDYMHFLTSDQFIQTARETFDANAYPYNTLSRAFIAPHEQLLYNQFAGLINDETANASLDSLAGINNAQQIKDMFYRNVIANNHTLSISGGNKLYAAYSSFSYTNNQSGTPGVSSKTYKLNLNQSYNPTKFLSLTLFTALNNNLSKAGNTPVIGAGFLPYQLFQDAAGNSINMPYLQGLSSEVREDYEQRSRINLDYNPLDERDYGFTSSNRTSINLIGGIGLKLWKGLSFQGNYGFQKSPGTSHSYKDISSFGLRKELINLTVAPTVDSHPIYYLPTSGGTYDTGNYEQKSWTVRNQLLYNSRFREGKDYLSIQAGQEAREQLTTSSSSTIRGYDLDLQTYPLLDYSMLSTGISNTVSAARGRVTSSPFSNSETKSRFVSYFALASYTFDGKYSLDASWRMDRSTLVGSDQSAQDKPIWSIGGKWEVTAENFMKNFHWIDQLAIRGTYGITGNSPYVGTSATKDILGVENSASQPLPGAGASIDLPANNKLSWESTRTINFGINFAVLHSRLSGSMDLYDRKTTNLLAGIQLNPFVGSGSATGNLGNLSNKGVELSLTSRNIIHRDFKWNSTLIFSYDKNKLVSYEEDPIALSYATSKVAANYLIGYSMSSLFAYQFAGLDNLGDPLVRLNDGTVTKNKNVAQPADVAYEGTTLPVFNGGFSNTFSYKGLSLTANLKYNLGHVMRREVNQFYTGRLTGTAGSFTGNISNLFLDRWKQPGDELFTNTPSYVPGFASSSRRYLNYYTYGDINVVSASYIKLRDVSLSYSLPANVLRTLKLSSASIFLQASNFLLWTANNDGIDPEYSNLSMGSRSLPYNHSFSIGTNISF